MMPGEGRTQLGLMWANEEKTYFKASYALVMDMAFVEY